MQAFKVVSTRRREETRRYSIAGNGILYSRVTIRAYCPRLRIYAFLIIIYNVFELPDVFPIASFSDLIFLSDIDYCA